MVTIPTLKTKYIYIYIWQLRQLCIQILTNE